MTAELDSTIAVVAHGLLNVLASMQGAVRTAREHHERLDHERLVGLLDLAIAQGALMEGMLRDLVSGLEPEVHAALDAGTGPDVPPAGFDGAA